MPLAVRGTPDRRGTHIREIGIHTDVRSSDMASMTRASVATSCASSLASPSLRRHRRHVRRSRSPQQPGEVLGVLASLSCPRCRAAMRPRVRRRRPNRSGTPRSGCRWSTPGCGQSGPGRSCCGLRRCLDGARIGVERPFGSVHFGHRALRPMKPESNRSSQRRSTRGVSRRGSTVMKTMSTSSVSADGSARLAAARSAIVVGQTSSQFVKPKKRAVTFPGNGSAKL